MSAEAEECRVTIERVGDTLVVVLPSGGQHYELTLSTDVAIRLGAALVRVAADTNRDSLSDVELDRAFDVMEGP